MNTFASYPTDENTPLQDQVKQDITEALSIVFPAELSYVMFDHKEDNQIYFFDLWFKEINDVEIGMRKTFASNRTWPRYWYLKITFDEADYKLCTGVIDILTKAYTNINVSRIVQEVQQEDHDEFAHFAKMLGDNVNRENFSQPEDTITYTYYLPWRIPRADARTGIQEMLGILMEELLKVSSPVRQMELSHEIYVSGDIKNIQSIFNPKAGQEPRILSDLSKTRAEHYQVPLEQAEIRAKVEDIFEQGGPQEEAVRNELKRIFQTKK